MQKVGYGILGVGKLTSKSLVSAFKFCKHSKLVALGSRDVAKARKKVKDADGIFWGSYDEVLAHPDVQVVYVALPNHLHAKWAIKAMQQGKAVLCEKPICTSLCELEDMISVSKQTNQLLADGFMYRFHPQHQKVKEILDSGILGELQLFKAQFSYHLTDPHNIRLKPECHGGALNDVGCYLLDSLLWLSNSSIESFQIDQKEVQSGIDESTALQIKMNSGLIAQLFCSTKSPRINFYQWVGEKGTLEVPQAYIPASGKPVHLILKTESGQEVIKVPGVNQYALQMDHFSLNYDSREHFVKKEPLEVHQALYRALELMRSSNEKMGDV